MGESGDVVGVVEVVDILFASEVGVFNCGVRKAIVFHLNIYIQLGDMNALDSFASR